VYPDCWGKRKDSLEAKELVLGKRTSHMGKGRRIREILIN